MKSINNFDSQTATTIFLLSSLGCIVLFYTLKYFWSRRYLYYYASKLPGPTPAWPVLGNALHFIGGNQDIFENMVMLFNKYKTPGRFWLGHRLIIGITQPKDLEVIMNKCLHKEKLYDCLIPVAGTGLFTAPVDKWKRHKKIIISTFKQQILNDFVEIFAEQTAILVTKLEDYSGKECFNVLPLLSSCSVDIITETTTGKKIYSQTQESQYLNWVARSMEIMFSRIFQFWLHFDFIWKFTALYRELDNNSKNIKNFLRKIIEKKHEEYRTSKALNRDTITRRKVLLDHLIELSEETTHWSDDEILEEITTIMITGSDSTSTASSFILVMLGMHPEIQEKVYQEIFDIFGDDNRYVTPEDLPKMTYLERVIKETLRLFPVGPAIGRIIHEDMQLESHLLPKGSSCILSIINTHRDPKIWPDPLKFDPDRFLPEETAKRHPYSFVPFSAGPRGCIGIKHGMMALKSIVSSVVRHFKITTDFQSVADVKVKAALVIKPVDGCRVGLVCREDH